MTKIDIGHVYRPLIDICLAFPGDRNSQKDTELTEADVVPAPIYRIVEKMVEDQTIINSNINTTMIVNHQCHCSKDAGPFPFASLQLASTGTYSLA